MFDCQSRILQFVIWLLFFCGFFLGVWIKMPRERSCWNQNGFMVTWLVIYVCLHILHPYRNFLRKAWENSGATVLAKTVAAKLKIKKTTTEKNSTFCIFWDKMTCTQPMSVLKYGYSSIPIIPQLHSEQNQNYDAR